MASTQATGAAPSAARCRFAFCRGLGEGRSNPRADRSPAPLLFAIDQDPARYAHQGGAENRRGKSQAQQAPPALTGGPRLCPSLGKLRLAQSPLDAAQIARQAADHRTGITRPVLGRGG